VVLPWSTWAIMATLRRFMLFSFCIRQWLERDLAGKTGTHFSGSHSKTWNTSAPFFRSSRNPCGSTYANFGDKGALATLYISSAAYSI